ncbi:LIM domain-containing protein 1 [Salminus brasiliensis]|uniref:LIM domain-containing protein 1 n=1 Tax=Salminus brasiliensis TaxID=930266 RepID=UPI003B82CA05
MAVRMDTRSDSDSCFGVCVTCREAVCGGGQACRAMGRLYHDRCFTCCICSKKLRGSPFYYMCEQVFCEEDFLIVQAVGKSFHPACFRCVICKHSLEGEPFSVDAQSQIYCIKDFQRSVAPTCKACGLLILPPEGSAETIQVVSMEQSYHLECFQDIFGGSAINNS